MHSVPLYQSRGIPGSGTTGDTDLIPVVPSGPEWSQGLPEGAFVRLLPQLMHALRPSLLPNLPCQENPYRVKHAPVRPGRRSGGRRAPKGKLGTRVCTARMAPIARIARGSRLRWHARQIWDKKRGPRDAVATRRGAGFVPSCLPVPSPQQGGCIICVCDPCRPSLDEAAGAEKYHPNRQTPVMTGSLARRRSPPGRLEDSCSPAIRSELTRLAACVCAVCAIMCIRTK